MLRGAAAGIWVECAIYYINGVGRFTPNMVHRMVAHEMRQDEFTRKTHRLHARIKKKQ